MPAPQKLQRSYCDALSQYTQAISRVPLLTNEQEITLVRAVQALCRFEEITEELTLRSGGFSPSDDLVAAEAGLTPDELQRKLRLGSRASQHMCSANLRLVVTIVCNYANQHLQLQDLIQEGNPGLMKAVDRFDPSRGYKFSTYSYWWIREGIARTIASKARTIRLPVHVGEHLGKLRRAHQQLG